MLGGSSFAVTMLAHVESGSMPMKDSEAFPKAATVLQSLALIAPSLNRNHGAASRDRIRRRVSLVNLLSQREESEEHCNEYSKNYKWAPA
jgi:hypothetical protein